MDKIIIGSTCLNYWFDDFTRKPKDVDYAVKSKSGYKSSRETEYLENPILFNYSNSEYLEPDLLYTLKISHLFHDINWNKHIYDVQFLKKKGCKLNKQLFNELYDYWTVVHSKNKRSDLKMSKDDFFNNAIKFPVEHDVLHTFLNPIPVYTKILIGEVEVCENKFNLLSHQDKLDLVREEIYVMSLERYSNDDYRVGYEKMLKKFIIFHAPIFEAIFIIENYIELHKPTFNYKKYLNERIEEYING